jgi:hypothetical protein
MPAREQTHPIGLTWTIDDEAMTRSWHAITDGGQVWLVDPVDEPGVVDRARELGRIAGVIQLLDRHNRDCAPIAERLGVPHHRLPRDVGDSPFRTTRVVSTPVWKEVALWWPERRVLVVAEAVGANRMFAVGSDPLGVHSGLRLFPPRALARYEPDHLLLGHGGYLGPPEAGPALSRAVHRSRRDVPKLLLQLPGALRA